MPGTVELMAVPEIGPALFNSVADKVGIQITVLPLGFLQQIDCLIRVCFQLRIRLQHQFITQRLKPFAEIAVLKYHSIIGALLFPRGQTDIVNAVRRLRTGDFIIQHLPLIPQHMLMNTVHNSAQKPAGYGSFTGQDTSAELILIHVFPLP